MPDATGPQSVLWHERDMARIARRLHDRVGPALCAAGLHLSLIEQALKQLPGSEAAQAVEGLREALTESTDEVRTLNYVCDPALVRRLGLKTAVAYLARMVRLDPGEMGEAGGRKDAAAARTFSMLRQALLFWSEQSADTEFVLVWSLRAVRIAASGPAPGEVAELASAAGGRISKDRMSVTLKLSGQNGGSVK